MRVGSVFVGLFLVNLTYAITLPQQFSFLRNNKNEKLDLIKDLVSNVVHNVDLKIDFKGVAELFTANNNRVLEIWEKYVSVQDLVDLNKNLVSKPLGKISFKDKKFWDFTLNTKDNDYQLRGQKIKNPGKLGVDPDVNQYSGYLDVAEDDKHFFYWFFESRNDPENDPVILWLNGGPGCSSMTGLFFELGSSSIGKNLKPIYNPYSWNSNASVIFLDQPVNVGFSYSGSAGVSNTIAASKDIYNFLNLFFKQFPKFAKNDFHIAGESYAGHYIPVFATEILSHPVEERSFNLSSVMIGNGLTDPLNQYPYYKPMACGEGGANAVLSPDECQSMEDSLDRCLSLIESCYNSNSVWTCVPASIYCNNAQLLPYQRTGKNVYDIRKECENDSLCYNDLQYIDEYLNEEDVQREIGAEVSNFQSCNFDINKNFLFNGDWMKPYQVHVTKLLDDYKLPVLIYAGDKDFICNWLGNQHWTDVLPWEHSKKFQNAEIKKYHSSLKGESAGEYKSYKNFTFLRLFNGGHMVPYDQPENSLNMVNDWIHNGYKL